MSVSRRDLRIAFLVGMFVMIVAAPVVGQVLSGLIATSGTIPMQTNSGVTVNVAGASDMAGSDFPYDNTVDVVTDQGNITISGNDPANVSIAASDITGTYTNATELDVQDPVTLNPENKAKITVEGDATDLAWSDYGLDDGQTDLVISGPDGTSSTIYLYNLPSDITVSAINTTTGKTVAVNTTNINGQLALDIDHSTQTLNLQSGDQSTIPTLANPSPTGDLSTPPSELSIGVNDTDFPDDNVSVTFDFDGVQQNTTHITSNSTVTEPLPSNLDSGQHTWEVNATDKFGNSEIESYSFTVPGNISIYNETPNATGQHELLDGVNISVEATTTGSEGTAFKQTVTDGTIDLEGLPTDETYIITLDGEGYYVRSVYLPNLYEQDAVYLLNKSQPSTENTISLNDRTGNFDDNPVLLTQRVINTSNVSKTANNGYEWETIGGDRLGADGQFVAHLEQTERYRFVVINTDGDRRVLGEYTAELDGPIELTIGSVSYEFGNESVGYRWDATIENETDTDPIIRFAYNDFDNLTDEIQLEIQYRDNGTPIAIERFTNGPFGELVYTQVLSEDQYENHSFVVLWEAERGGETITGKTYVGAKRPLTLPIDTYWKHVLYAAITLLLAFIVGVGIGPAAGITTVGMWTGVAWYIDLVPTELGAGAVILIMLIGAWTTMREQEPEVIQ
jgi:hypothetical protein